MNSVAASLTLAAVLVLAATAQSAGLSDPEVVDYVLANPTTGQAALILTVDRSLAVEDAEQRFDRKVTYYASFVETGQLYRAYPQVKQSVPVGISIVLEDRPSPTVIPKLLSAKTRLEGLGFQVQIRAYDPSQKRLVDLEL